LARVHLTGGIRMNGPDGAFVDSDLPGNQGRIAFVALVSERRPISYDVLADIVWDDRLPSNWKGALAAVVSKIRSLVTAIGLDGRETIPASGGAYAFVPPAGTWVDLEEAYLRVERAGRPPARGDDRRVRHRRRPAPRDRVSTFDRRRDRAGDHGAALRAFGRCERILRDELGVHPSSETIAIIERFR